MTVKLKDVIASFNLKDAKQIGSKQLFTGYSELYKCNVYISYCTIIAFKDGDTWWMTAEKYSVTTSRHKNEIKKMEKNVIIHDNYDFRVRLDRLAMLSLL